MPDNWELDFSAAYLVKPSRIEGRPGLTGKVKGSKLNVSEAVLKSFLLSLHSEKKKTLPTEVIFIHEAGKEQNNEVRELFRKVAFFPVTEKRSASRKLAKRLALSTDGRSGSCLFVILSGKKEGVTRFFFWSFPADTPLEAKILEGDIKIKLLEDAYAINSPNFKAAIFEGDQSRSGFWDGRIEDKSAYKDEVSQYWRTKFLDCRIKPTESSGSRMLISAVKECYNSNDLSLEQKDNLMEAVDDLISEEQTEVDFDLFATEHITDDTSRDKFVKYLRAKSPLTNTLPIKAEYLERDLGVKTIHLDNKIKISAPAENFDELVNVTEGENGAVQITISGRIVDTKLKKK